MHTARRARARRDIPIGAAANVPADVLQRRGDMRRMTVAVAGLLVLLTVVAGHAQPAKPPASAGDDTGFVDYLRRQDPAAAERFIQLRDARDAAIENLRR